MTSNSRTRLSALLWLRHYRAGLYRRFPIGRALPPRQPGTLQRARRLEALRSSRLETCATTLSTALPRIDKSKADSNATALGRLLRPSVKDGNGEFSTDRCISISRNRRRPQRFSRRVSWSFQKWTGCRSEDRAVKENLRFGYWVWSVAKVIDVAVWA